MLRFLTAGESHGPAEVAILEGIPAGLPLITTDIQQELDKRRVGSGRGGRGQIEKDQVKILSGVRFGKTLGSPIALMVENQDFVNWKEKMSIEDNPAIDKESIKVATPRPGHADLAGSLKYGFDDIRNVIERASARETIMRVAVGAICKKFLKEFNIEIKSQILEIGNWKLGIEKNGNKNEKIDKLIRQAQEKSDTLGGVIEIVGRNIPPGLGSYVHYDKRLDGRLAQMLMSIPSVKAVEIGEGIVNASKFGSEVHDEIYYKSGSDLKGVKGLTLGYFRKTNRAGGIEGGISNGENIICRVYHKPLATLGKPLKTVDIKTKKPAKAVIERSDVCVVPRAGVISEAAVAFVLTDAFLEKFDGDSIAETKRNFEGYMK